MKTDDQLRTRDLRSLQLLPRNYRHAIVDLLRRSTIESLMWALPGKPIKVTTQGPLHRIAIERNKDAPQPFILQREKEPLDHGGRSDTLRCRVSLTDAFSIAPGPVAATIELTALVRDEVRRSTVAFHDATKEGADIDRLRLFLEYGEAHYPS